MNSVWIVTRRVQHEGMNIVGVFETEQQGLDYIAWFKRTDQHAREWEGDDISYVVDKYELPFAHRAVVAPGNWRINLEPTYAEFK